MGSCNSEVTPRQGERCLLLDAAAVMRRRYVRGNGDDSVSASEAEELARILEGLAKADPALNTIDRNEAIALANRLLDDDHPERSRMWPA